MRLNFLSVCYLNVPVVPDCPLPGTFSGQLHSVVIGLLEGAGEGGAGFAALVEEE